MNKITLAYKKSLDFYNLFFSTRSKIKLIDYLENAPSDEISLINHINDTYNILFVVEGKYYNVEAPKRYSKMYELGLNEIVHPDDKEIYEDLLEPTYIYQKLINSKTPNFRFAHFRIKTINNTYRWVERVLVTGKENGLVEGQIKLYTFDIKHKLGTDQENEIGLNLLENQKDSRTGLLFEKPFFRHCEANFEANPDLNWCMISIDIEHLRLFDEWFGREAGDELLYRTGTILIKYAKEIGVAGYFGQDDFALFIEYKEEVVNKIYDEIKECTTSFDLSAGFLPAFGVCLLKNSKSFVDALDKASIGNYRAKHNMKNRIFVYDEKINSQEEKLYRTVVDFMRALKENEITFYLQPQVRVSTNTILGAEALARWIKKDGTIIPPCDFVPALEKYGFIGELDIYIWDKVCSWLAENKKKGLQNVPISVNLSQVDIYTKDLSVYFDELIKKYDLTPNLFKIEITESAYAGDDDLVYELVQNLRNQGFTVLIDDFGSRYSSLNMLSSLNIDAIKLDGEFLHLGDSSFVKGVHIIESVINMSKIISLPIIVEGVENKQQVDFLASLGVEYVQGYYFYKPMPKEQFEKILNNKSMIDKVGLVAKSNDQFRVKEFLDSHIYSDAMLNNILGPVAIYSWHNNSVDIVRYNQQFFETVDDKEFHGRLTDIQNFLPEEDIPKIFAALQESMDNKLNGCSSEILRFKKTDGVTTSYIIRFYFLGESEGTKRFYGSAHNITELVDLKQQMELINKFSSDTILFLKHIDGKWSFKVAAHGLESLLGIKRNTLENELNSFSIFERLDKEVANNLNKSIVESLENKKRLTYRIEIKTDNGPLPLHITLDPVYDQTNNVEYIATIRRWY